MSRINVTMITLAARGGMVHYVSQISNSLAELADVTVILPRGCTVQYFTSKVKLSLIGGTSLDNVFTRNSFVFELPSAISKSDPDIVHFSGSHPAILLAFLTSRALGCPFFVTLHDVRVHSGERRLTSQVSNFMNIALGDYLLVHGTKLRDELLAMGKSPDQVFVVRHGEYSFFKVFQAEGVEEERATILFFGRILEYKGLRYLLAAFRHVKSQVPEARLVIAGRGDLKGYLNLIKELSDVEVINGYIPDDAVAKLFQRSTVVVLPYIEGSQSGVVPIAYSFGKPVVTTDVGSIAEVVDDGLTGFVVPPRDEMALAEALVRILTDQGLRKDMGLRALQKANRELAWDAISSQLFELYQEALRGHRKSRKSVAR